MGDSAPNVVLLSADALRADHLSCHGYPRDTSPRLDEFAERNVWFRNCHSASSHTREAVPSLLTGRYPDRAVDGCYHLGAETLADRLKRREFATGAFHSNPYVSRAYGFESGFDEFDDDLHLGQHKLVALFQRALDKLRNRHYARAEEINERSLSWLDGLDGERPFFLWNHYMDTHGPYEPPGEYRDLYADDRVSDAEAQDLYRRAIERPDSVTDRERDRLVDLYDAEIRYTDRWIGRFLDELADRDLLSNAYVFVTADHGDAFDEHGYYEHPRYLHDELTHVPLMVRRPDGRSATVDGAVSTLDVVATCLSLVGLDAADGAGGPLPGEDLFDGASGGDERTVFSQARGEKEDANRRRYSAKTVADRSYLEFDTEAGTVVSTETVGDPDLESALRGHVGDRPANDAVAGAPSGANDEIERRLSALGYKE